MWFIECLITPLISVWGPMYVLTVCINDRYNLPWSIDSIQNTLVRVTNYENKTISCIQNVTQKYCREKSRFLGWLNQLYYHKWWYFRPKNDLCLMARTYVNQNWFTYFLINVFNCFQFVCLFIFLSLFMLVLFLLFFHQLTFFYILAYQLVKAKNAVTGIEETFPQLTIKGVGYAIIVVNNGFLKFVSWKRERRLVHHRYLIIGVKYWRIFSFYSELLYCQSNPKQIHCKHI